MDWVVSFQTEDSPDLFQVGGKGLSLIFMTRHGLNVPPGFILSAPYFEPWMAFIKRTPEWRQVLEGPPKTWKYTAPALKARCAELTLDDVHKQVLERSLSSLNLGGKTALYAVRSSSPEEDLEGLSFAGGYETVLGVQRQGLEEALRRAFASCLDERVLVYKQEHGLAVENPRMAAIIQQQIPADMAGVAFSLNPLNNCYDEAVINANFGLGESVVSGQVSPDLYVVDKVTRTLLERRIGRKETSIWLAKGGGTYRKASPLRDQACLAGEEVLDLVSALDRLEEVYQKPIDMEWAYASGQLYLLQARPITTFIPLPEAMQTAPGEPKLLYLDMTFSKQGIHEPMSVLGTDFMAIIQRALFEDLAGRSNLLDVKNGLACTLEGRAYINVSNTIKVQGKKRLVDEYRTQDVLAAEILENLDESEYVSRKTPPNLRGLVLKLLWHSFGSLRQAYRAYRKPAAYKEWYHRQEEQFLYDLGEIEIGPSPRRVAAELASRYVRFLNDVTLPMTYAAELARGRMKKIFKDELPEIRERLVYLERALPENITLEMGLAMYHLARFPEIAECESGEQFAARLKERDLSPEFREAWNAFMDDYGFRCPRELDAATSRPYEQPERFFERLRLMALNQEEALDPYAVYDRSRQERQAAFEALMELARSKGRGAARKFERNYHILVEFGGYREIHKYYYIRVVDAMRRRALASAQLLLQAGRLEGLEQVFDLTIAELSQAIMGPGMDVGALGEKNTRFLRRIRHIHDFPRLIDSRGKILHPPKRETGPGGLAGDPIAPGCVRGRVKVLHDPTEKPLLPGEILVACVTDPGWTPLFINAAAVVLEVGGLLQHGALVAREYGKPCVAGIENATELLQDGQLVEVDGANGVVRVLQRASDRFAGLRHLRTWR